jgi:very-short-patch-repair endonuclease
LGEGREGVELDGSQHLEQEEYDDERTKFLESKVIESYDSGTVM